MDTHLQRPTDTLQFSQTRLQIQALFDAAYIMSKGQYAQSVKHFQDILQTIPQMNFNPYELQIRYNKMLAQIYTSKQFPLNFQQLIINALKQLTSLQTQIQRQEAHYLEEQEQDEWEYGEDLRVRIYTTLLQLSVKSEKIKIQEWLNKLLSKLKLYPKYMPEVLGKLCGCKYLKEFCSNFNSDQILSNSSKSNKDKAEMIDLASSWYIVGGKLDEGLKNKQIAVNLWKNSNHLKQFQKCEKELSELKKNSNSQYCITLKKVARITTKILKEVNIDQQYTKRKQQNNISMIVKKSMYRNLTKIAQFAGQIQQFEQESKKGNEKKSFWSSSGKKSTLSSAGKASILDKSNSKLYEYYEKSNEFYKQCFIKQKNQQITSLLADKSKFVLEQKKIMSKLMVPLIQQYTKRQKYAFYKIKTDYIMKQDLKNPQFLNKNNSREGNISKN